MQNVKVYIKFESNENIQNYHYLNVITLEKCLNTTYAILSFT